MCLSSHDYADVQTLYKQCAEHAAEQNHLIKQLEGLNLDTQKVLRNQEEAHSADTTSYQMVRLHQTHTLGLKIITVASYSDLYFCCDLFPGLQLHLSVTTLLALFRSQLQWSSCYAATVGRETLRTTIHENITLTHAIHRNIPAIKYTFSGQHNSQQHDNLPLHDHSGMLDETNL